MEMNVEDLVAAFNRLLEKQIAAPAQLVDYVTKLTDEYIKLWNHDQALALIIANRQLELVTALISTSPAEKGFTDADLYIEMKTVKEFVENYGDKEEFFKINLTTPTTPPTAIVSPPTDDKPYYKPGILFGRSTGTGVIFMIIVYLLKWLLNR